MTIIVISIYMLAMAILLVLSLGQLHLAWIYRKSMKKQEDPHLAKQDDWPVVTVQLPIYNELYVVERLIDSVAQLDYPKDKLEIQILDDSTDETSQLIAHKVEPLKKDGYHVAHIQRQVRAGYKAGALQYGLEQSIGEFIAIFDADFLPPKAFLKSIVPHFVDNKIGMVQTRWGHLNDDFSLLTKLQAFGLDGHFTVEQSGRNAAGSFINFNGTGGVWRKSCIVEAGGWSADTLTEDLDLSYRAQLKGWRFRYLQNELTPAELPVVMSAVKSQQYRWNKGAAETAKKTIGKIIDAKLPKRQKIHALLHLANNSVFPLMLIASIISLPMLYLKHQNPQLIQLFHLATIFAVGFVAISYFYWLSALSIKPGQPLKYWGQYFPAFMAYSMGLSLHNAIAVTEGYLGIRTPFIRTPKFNAVGTSMAHGSNRYVLRAWHPMIILELILSVYFIFGVVLGVSLSDYGLLPFHLMMAAGYGLVVYYGVAEHFTNVASEK